MKRPPRLFFNYFLKLPNDVVRKLLPARKPSEFQKNNSPRVALPIIHNGSVTVIVRGALFFYARSFYLRGEFSVVTIKVRPVWS